MDPARLSSLRIGLTGGIGSGKSTVASLLVGCGAVLVDTDLIARQLTLSGGAAINAIAEAFGAEAIDATGALDRARMRARVFSNASAKQRLEAILHPMIGAETERQASCAATTSVIFDVPLLAESAHWRAKVDKVLVIDCHDSTQLERVVSRSGWTEAAAQAVIAQQASRKQRRACADAVIYNDAITLAKLDEEVRWVWHRWHPASR